MTIKLKEGVIMLICDNLSVSYQKKDWILENLSFQMKPGEVVGLIAPNGTGKTTMLKAISGLNKISYGNCTINGFDIVNNREKYLYSLFFIENTDHLYEDFTVLDLLKMVKSTWHSKKEIEEVSKIFNIESYYPLKIKKLSLGMKQHVLITLYVLSNCDVLLLDEPLNGLDPTSVFILTDLFQSLRAEGKTILLSSHNLINISEVCTTVMFLKNKRIEKVTDSNENLEGVYKQLYTNKVGEK